MHVRVLRRDDFFKGFAAFNPSWSVVSTFDVGGKVLKSFQAVWLGSVMASSAPRPEICTRTVMGSPTARFVGPAVAVMVKSPTAPLKSAGTFSAGSGSDSAFDCRRGERNLFLFALIEKLPEERIAACHSAEGTTIRRAGGERAEAQRAAFHGGQRKGQRNHGVNVVADLGALLLALGHFADGEAVRLAGR